MPKRVRDPITDVIRHQKRICTTLEFTLRSLLDLPPDPDVNVAIRRAQALRKYFAKLKTGKE